MTTSPDPRSFVQHVETCDHCRTHALRLCPEAKARTKLVGAAVEFLSKHLEECPLCDATPHQLCAVGAGIVHGSVPSDRAPGSLLAHVEGCPDCVCDPSRFCGDALDILGWPVGYDA